MALDVLTPAEIRRGNRFVLDVIRDNGGRPGDTMMSHPPARIDDWSKVRVRGGYAITGPIDDSRGSQVTGTTGRVVLSGDGWVVAGGYFLRLGRPQDSRSAS